ncbi:MAG: lipase maturation factor family protein [Myxococcota bacterium]
MNPYRTLERPLVVYDGACGFCKRCVARFQVVARGAVDVAPSQEVAARFALPPEDCARAVQYLDPDGERHQGAEAVFRALAAAGRPRGLWLYRHVPGVGIVTRLGYRFIARFRGPVSRLTSLLHDRDLREDPWLLTRALYLRFLGLVLLVASLSYSGQILGLNGAEGILPAADFVERVQAVGVERGWSTWEVFQVLPSLFPLSPTDATLSGLALGATLSAALMVLGLLMGPALLAFILCWSSIVAVGGVFTGYQWDTFTLEVCIASLAVAPWRVGPSLPRRRRAPLAGRWLLRIILFKFMLLNGLVKWQSGDAPWDELTAMQFHYWTQPIPHAVSWYAHHLPAWLHEASVVGMFVIELALPFFILGTRRMRQLACLGTVALMLLIVATGNYGIFNLLTIALCLALLDDGAVRRLLPDALAHRLPDTRSERHEPAHWAIRSARGSVVAALILLNLWVLAQRSGVETPKSEVIEVVAKTARSLNICGTYGAFANMTEDRPEILIEGSVDGVTWRPYPLRYKTLELDRPHGFAGPHMPRLDWQLWFAALRQECRRTRWYLPFMTRLLEGRAEVLALFADDPFPDGPPTYLRSTLWSYTFTTERERGMTGDVWKRTPRGTYCPTLTLRDGKPVVATLP